MSSVFYIIARCKNRDLSQAPQVLHPNGVWKDWKDKTDSVFTWGEAQYYWKRDVMMQLHQVQDFIPTYIMFKVQTGAESEIVKEVYVTR